MNMYLNPKLLMGLDPKPKNSRRNENISSEFLDFKSEMHAA